MQIEAIRQTNNILCAVAHVSSGRMEEIRVNAKRKDHAKKYVVRGDRDPAKSWFEFWTDRRDRSG